MNEVLPDPQDVKDMNAALENVAMTLGKPAGAFPQQDHLAHLQVHLDYLKDPMYGANPIMAPIFLPQCLEHIKQHLTLWYLNQMDSYTSAALDRPFNVLKVEPLMREAQQLLAAAGQHVHQDVQQQLAGIQPLIQAALQTLQQTKPQPPQDPSIQAIVQTQMAETQRKAQNDQARVQIDNKKIDADMKKSSDRLVADEQMKAAELTHDINTLTIERKYELQQAQQDQLAAMQQAEQQQQSELQAAMAAHQTAQQPVQP